MTVVPQRPGMTVSVAAARKALDHREGPSPIGWGFGYAIGGVLQSRSMALLDDKALLKLPVYTKSGANLGKLVGFEFEAESQVIIRWRVRPKGISARLVGGPLLIAREQVLSITAERMTVDDNVEKAVELEKAKALGLVADAS